METQHSASQGPCHSATDSHPPCFEQKHLRGSCGRAPRARGGCPRGAQTPCAPRPAAVEARRSSEATRKRTKRREGGSERSTSAVPHPLGLMQFFVVQRRVWVREKRAYRVLPRSLRFLPDPVQSAQAARKLGSTREATKRRLSNVYRIHAIFGSLYFWLWSKTALPL